MYPSWLSNCSFYTVEGPQGSGSLRNQSRQRFAMNSPLKKRDAVARPGTEHDGKISLSNLSRRVVRSSPVETLVQRLDAKRNGNGWIAKCPAHNDRTPSLSISQGTDGRCLIKCHAGCDTSDIVAKLGLNMADLFSNGEALHRSPKAPPPPFDWRACARKFKNRHAATLVRWRGYSPEIVAWLRENALVGMRSLARLHAAAHSFLTDS